VACSAEERGEVERRPQERGERRREFSSALLSPFSSLLPYYRGAAMEAAARTRNGYQNGACFYPTITAIFWKHGESYRLRDA